MPGPSWRLEGSHDRDRGHATRGLPVDLEDVEIIAVTTFDVRLVEPGGPLAVVGEGHRAGRGTEESLVREEVFERQLEVFLLRLLLLVVVDGEGHGEGRPDEEREDDVRMAQSHGSRP